MRGRWQFLAVALLTLVSQAAAASHIPALDDEPVSKCTDGSLHYCAEVVEDDAGPCALCQVGAGSVSLSLVTVSAACVLAEPVVVVDASGPRLAGQFSPASPRAPPIA